MTASGLARASVSLSLAVGLSATSAPADQRAANASQEAPIVVVATVVLVDGRLEFSRKGGPWRPAPEQQTLAVGDRVRTPAGSSARLEFPWTMVTLGDQSLIALEGDPTLSVRLEAGRIDMDPEAELIRLVTKEAAVSGAGRTILRREGETTFVVSLVGGAEVEAAGKTVRLGVGRSVLVGREGPGEPAVQTPGPRVVFPGADPLYVRPNDAVRLEWTGASPGYLLEVLPLDSETPVISLDVAGTTREIRLPWLGTFRWRVTGRQGAIETQSSGEGLICVVEK